MRNVNVVDLRGHPDRPVFICGLTGINHMISTVILACQGMHIDVMVGLIKARHDRLHRNPTKRLIPCSPARHQANAGGHRRPR